MAFINNTNPQKAKHYTLAESDEIQEIRLVVRSLYDFVIGGKPITSEAKEEIKKVFELWEKEAVK